MKKVNISFIIPAYNCESTLTDSVDSIFNDNFTTGDELIIVNDNSTDNTGNVVKKLKYKYPLIKNKLHQINKGGGAARNTAVKMCRNHFIFCLDSDNILEKKSITYLREAAKIRPEAIISFRELKYFNGTTKNISHSWIFKYDIYDQHNYLSTNVVPGASGNYLFTKKSWMMAGGYPENSGALDTWGFGLKQVMSGFQMLTIPNTFYFHRIGTESYWVRESKKHNMSDLAAKLIEPYSNRLNDLDRLRLRIDRMLHKEWFTNLDRRPIHLKRSQS